MQGFIPHGTVQAACSLLNLHWFPPDCPCERGSQPPSIRKDVKYRARRTRIESGREGGGGGGGATRKGRKRTDEIKEVKQRAIKGEKDAKWLLDRHMVFSNLKLLYASFS